MAKNAPEGGRQDVDRVNRLAERCRCAQTTLFAPAGQKRFRAGAPDFGRVAGESCLWSALPFRNGWQARREDGSMPSCAPRGRRVPATIPRGERRALPAPAQGIHPLRIPFGERQPFPRSPRPPKRRRRTAPARGPSAVYSLYRPIRNETQNARPLLVGRAFVDLEPTALADRTAVTRESWSRRRNRPCGRLRE